jgi:hypothetical protein
MGDAVAAFDAAWMALADHHACSLEAHGARRSIGFVDVMDLAAERAGFDVMAQLDERLEKPHVARENVIVTTCDLP